MNALKAFLANAPRGTAARLAARLGVSQVVVSQWVADVDPRPVPAKQRPGIEQFTEGAVPVEAYDDTGVHWVRVPDEGWPWHADGRPALDITKEAA